MENELLEILKKVKALYIKYGIKSITMDDVARELGISKKTLYQYVQNKDELVEKVVDLHQAEQDVFFEKIKSKKLNAIQSLLWVNKLISKMMEDYNPSVEFDLKKYHSSVFRKIKERGQKKMFDSVLDNIIQGKKEGLYRSNINETLIAKMYVLRVEMMMESDVISRDEMRDPENIGQILEYHIRGIASEKGIKEYEEYKKYLDNANNTL